MTDRQDARNKPQNINQDVRASGNSKVTAIAYAQADTIIVNNADRNVLLDDWKPSIEHMQGRKEAIAALNIALADPKKAIACIVGLGGYGKSTLAAKLFDEWQGRRFWADVGQRSRDFRKFATRAIAQLGQKSLKQVKNLPEAQLSYELAAVLQGKGYLVVLDNLESLLDGDRNLENVLWREFLQNWANDGEGSKVLITTREEPSLPKMRLFRYKLRDGLDDTEGAAVLRDFGILGTEAELVEVSQRVGGIPLSLMLIVGLLCNDYEENPHVCFLPDDLFGIEGAHRLGRVTTEAVFRASFERLEPRLQNLLMAVSVFAKPFDCTMAAAMIVDEQVTGRDLLLLKKRGFVLAESVYYRFQPQIQKLVQRQAADLPELHIHAIKFYLTLCKAKTTLDPRHDTLEDADPYLQVFHHYCELGEYEKAFYTICNDLDKLNKIDEFLHFSGYSAKIIDLYPRLIKAWQPKELQQRECIASLISLGNAYNSLGQYQKAVESFQQSLKISTSQEINDKRGESRSLGGLGSVYQSLGQYKKALESFQQSLEISTSQEINDKRGEARSRGGLGSVYNSLGQYQKAAESFQKSLEISQEIKDKRGEARSRGGLGSVYNSLGQYQKAAESFQKSLEIAKTIGNKQDEAVSLCGLGGVYNSLGQYQKAVGSFQRSLKIAQVIGDKHGEASSLCSLGNAYNFLGQYQKAIESFQQSLDIAQVINVKEIEALSFCGLGYTYNFLGQYQKSIDSFQQSLEIAQVISDNRGKALSSSNLGNTYNFLRQYQEEIFFQSLGLAQVIGVKRYEALSPSISVNAYNFIEHYQEAIAFFQKTLEMAKMISDKRGEASSLFSLGNAYNILGKYQQAIEYFQQSLEIAQVIGDKRWQAVSLFNLGNAYNFLWQPQKAVEYLQQSFEIAQMIDDKQGELISLGNLGYTYNCLGQCQKAIEYFHRSLEIAQAISDKRGEAVSLFNLGNTYNFLGQPKKAIEYFHRSLEIAQAISDKHGEANSLFNLGNTYYFLRQPQEAIPFFQQSLNIKREIGDKYGEAISLMNLANAYSQIGRFKKVFIALNRANKILQELQLPLRPRNSAESLMLIIRFAQRGKWQIILCFCIGLFALPSLLANFLVNLVTRFLWRWLHTFTKR